VSDTPKNGNDFLKTIGMFILVLSILGSLAAIFQQQINSSGEKQVVSIQNLEKSLIELRDRNQRIEDRLRTHVENEEIHYGGLYKLNGKLDVLEERMRKCENWQKKNSN